MNTFGHVARASKYKQLSDTYAITHSPILSDRIFDEFTEEEILRYEDNAGIIYTLLKKQPMYINRVSEEQREFFLLELKDEFIHNVGIFDTVRQVINEFDLMQYPEYEYIVIEIIDEAIKHMKNQGFEILPLTITSSDINQLMERILEPIKLLDYPSAQSLISTYITPLNFSFMIEELCILRERVSETLFEDMINLINHTIYLVKTMDIPEPDYDSEDYNPLEESYLSREDTINLAYMSVPVDLYDYPKEDVMKIISVIRRMMESYIGIEGQDDMYRLCYRILSPFLDDIVKQEQIIDERNYAPELLVNDMREISELEYRIPRVLYLTSGIFEINRYLYDPVLFSEFKVLKDLKSIEQMYSSWYDAVALATGNELYRNKLSININTLLKLIPLEDSADDYYDDFIDIKRL